MNHEVRLLKKSYFAIVESQTFFKKCERKMDQLNAEKLAIGTLLSGNSFFRIPEYQRPFSWEVEHFEDLVDDIIKANRTQ